MVGATKEAMAATESIGAMYAQIAAMLQTLATDRAAILEPAQKRLAIQTLKARCEAMFPAIRRVMYETQCEPNVVVECRAALRDLQTQIEEQEKRLDFADYLQKEGLPNIGVCPHPLTRLRDCSGTAPAPSPSPWSTSAPSPNP